MTLVEQQEMVDAINLQSARIARLEDALRQVLAATAETKKLIAGLPRPGAGDLGGTAPAVVEAVR